MLSAHQMDFSISTNLIARFILDLCKVSSPNMHEFSSSGGITSSVAFVDGGIMRDMGGPLRVDSVWTTSPCDDLANEDAKSEFELSYLTGIELVSERPEQGERYESLCDISSGRCTNFDASHSSQHAHTSEPDLGTSAEGSTSVDV